MHRIPPAPSRRPNRAAPTRHELSVASAFSRARVACLLLAALLVSTCPPAGAQTNPTASPFVLNPLRISEAAASADVLFVLDEPAPSEINLLLSFIPDSNLPASAYFISEPHDRITVPSGEMLPEEPITIRSVDNSYFHGPRSITILALAAADSIGTLAGLGLPVYYRATLVINDDERPPDIEDPLTLQPASLSEAGAAGELSMEITFNALSDLHFDVSVSSSSKVPASNVTFPGRTRLSIRKGQRSTTRPVFVRVGDDFDVTGPRILTLVAAADENSAEALQDLGQPPRYEIDIEVSDNDRVDPTVSPLRVTPLSISEAGGEAKVRMVLPFPAPGNFDVEISVQDGDGAGPDDVTLSTPTSISFEAGSNRSSGRVTITAVDNDANTLDRTVEVVATPDLLVRRIFADHGFEEVFTAELTLTDDDESFVDDSPLLVAPAEVTEGGEAHVTAMLPFPAPAAVTAKITVEDARGRKAKGVSVSAPGALSFAKYATDPDRRLTITIDDDDRVSGPRDLTVVATVDPIAAALLAELGQSGEFTAPLTVNDDDRPAFHVSPARLTVTEGESARLTVSLSTRIDVPLTLRAVPASGTLLTVAPERIKFSPDDWSRPRTLRLSAGSDDDAVGGEHRVAFVLEGPPLARLRSAVVVVELIDPDRQALVVSPREIELTEGGPTATVAVSLAARPEAPVTLRYGLPPAPGAGSLEVTAPGGLVIPRNAWNQPHELVLSAPEDPDATGLDLGALAITAVQRGAAGLAPVTVLVSVRDNDVPSLTVLPDRLSLDEGGAPATVSVSLGARPQSAVTVTADVPADAPVEVSPDSIDIDPANWDRPVALTVAAPVDADADSYAGAITLVPTGPGAGALTPVNLSIEVEDSDPGLEVAPSVPVALQPGESATFTVAVPQGAGALRATVSVDEPLLLQGSAEIDLAGPGTSAVVTIAVPAETSAALPAVAAVRFVSSAPASAASVTRAVHVSAPSVSPDSRPLTAVFPGLVPAARISPVQLALGAGAGPVPVLVRLSSAPSAPRGVAVRIEGTAATDVRLAGPDGVEVSWLRVPFAPNSDRWRTGVPVAVLARRGARAGRAVIVAEPVGAPYPGAHEPLSARAVVRVVPPRANGTYPPGTLGAGNSTATGAAPDLNGDGVVNGDDLAVLDRDGDGSVDANDVAALDVDGDGDVDADDLRSLDADRDGDLDADDLAAVDFDGDGDVDSADVAVLDLDGDGVVDVADLGVLDVDGDGRVGRADLVAITSAGAAPDLNGDGVVNGDDLAVLDRDGDGSVDANDVAALDVDGDGDVDADDLRSLDADRDGDVDADDLAAVDFDGDGDVDSADVAVLDLDGDGVVDVADLGVLDVDGDGRVGRADLVAITSVGAAPDLNGDGVIDGDDLAVLDRDGDGSVDANDVAALDVDGDGDVDADDLRSLDADRDGDVDADDLAAVDFNGDGDVDSADVAVLDLDGDGVVDVADLRVLDVDGDGRVDRADLAAIAATGPRLLPAIESVTPLVGEIAVRFDGPSPSRVQWRSFSDTRWNGASHRPPLAMLSGLSPDEEYFVRVCDPRPSPPACTAPYSLPVRPLPAPPAGISPNASGALPAGAFFADPSGIAAPYEAPSRVELSPSVGGLEVRFEAALRMNLSNAGLMLVKPSCRASSPTALAHRVLVSPAPLVENLDVLEVRDLGPGIDSVRIDGLVPAERYEVLVRAISPPNCVSHPGGRRFEGLPARVHGTQVGHLALEAPDLMRLEALFEGFRAQWSAVPGAVAYRVEYLEGADADLSRYVPRAVDIVAAPTVAYTRERLRRGAVYSVRVRAIAHPRAALLRPGGHADASLLGPPSNVRSVEIGLGAPAPAAYADLAHAAASMLSRETGASVLRVLDARFSLGSNAHWTGDTRGSGLDGIAAGLATLPPGLLGRLGAERQDSRSDEHAMPWVSRKSRRNRVQRPPWSAWFAGDTAGMAIEHAGAEFDGSLDVLHIAVETAPGAAERLLNRSSPWVAGIGLGYANGHVDYTRGGVDAGTGRVALETVLTYPYAGYRTPTLSGYVTAGGGAGTSNFSDTRFEPDGSDQDHTLVFVGAGVSLPLIGAESPIQTLLRSSLVATRTKYDAGEVLDAFSVSAHQLRLGLESRYVRRMRSGTIVPSAGFGFRHLAGDDPTGTHLDASLGLDLTSGRLRLSGYAGMALLSGGDANTNWRAGVNARAAPRRGGRGLFFGVSPDWGLAYSPAGVSEGGLPGNVADDAASRAAYTAEIGYGFYSPALHGILIPFVSHRTERGGEASVNLGVRYRASSDLWFELRATGRAPRDADREESFSLRGRISF